MKNCVSVGIFAIGLGMTPGFCAAVSDASGSNTDANSAWIADSATISHIRDIVQKTPGTDGVFIVADDGSIHHIQSGLVCVPKFPNVNFWHAFIYKSPLGVGADVGCDYGRNGTGGYAVSKLTIFATKAPEGVDLDGAFTRYRGEVMQTYPNAISEGEAVKLENKDPNGKSPFPPMRSEEFDIQIQGREYTTDLLVAVKNGWMLEIRSTYLGKANEVNMSANPRGDEAAMSVEDRAMSAAAFIRAAGTIGRP